MDVDQFYLTFILLLYFCPTHSNDSFGEPAVKLRRSSSAMLDQLDQDIVIVDNSADGAARSEEVSTLPFMQYHGVGDLNEWFKL